MTGATSQPLHALEVPIRTLSLLVPSACVAEVVPPSALTALPLGPEWVLGVMGWRSRPVPVISLERVIGGAEAASEPLPAAETGARRRRSGKIVVFYPLPGRKPWEFFGIVACAEPQSRVLDSAALAGAVVVPNGGIIAMTVQFGNSAMAIPDMNALAAALYP
ncbi:MAG: chemotaxis protein CheW [Acidiferrobacterales bacterium]